MQLKHLTDQELIASTKHALVTMREAEVNILRHFNEIEERRLWVETGSIYKFIERTFALTADQIYPRLQAMRLMRAIPEVEIKLEQGELTVTNALKAHQAFQSESKLRVVTLSEKREVLKSLENSSTKDADKRLAQKYPNLKESVEKVKAIAPNQNLIQFYVDDETLKEIEDIKARFSHQMPSGKMQDLLKTLIQFAKCQVTPRKRMTIKTRSRHIPAELKREMEKTRHRGCNHLDANTGERCASKHFLQVDHLKPYSLGDPHELENLQWLCGFHNRHRLETGRYAANYKPN